MNPNVPKDWVIIVDFDEPIEGLVQYCSPKLETGITVANTFFPMPHEVLNARQPFRYVAHAEYLA